MHFVEKRGIVTVLRRSSSVTLLVLYSRVCSLAGGWNGVILWMRDLAECFERLAPSTKGNLFQRKLCYLCKKEHVYFRSNWCKMLAGNVDKTLEGHEEKCSAWKRTLGESEWMLSH